MIKCLSEFVWLRKHGILDYYAISADEVTNRFSNEGILLLHLHYERFCANEKPYNAKYFLILYISKVNQYVRLLEAVILLLLQRNGIDLSKCSVQAYDETSIISSEVSGAVSKIIA